MYRLRLGFCATLTLALACGGDDSGASSRTSGAEGAGTEATAGDTGTSAAADAGSGSGSSGEGSGDNGSGSSGGSSSTTSGSGDTTAGVDETTTGGGGDDGGTTGADDTSGSSSSGTGDPVTTESIEIVPSNVTLDVVDGVVPAAIDFAAIAHMSDGTDMELVGNWTTDRYDLIDVDNGDGVTAATGLIGGGATLTFNDGTDELSTAVNVRLLYTDDPGGVDPGIKADFDAPVGPDPSLAMLYPYDETVFPRGLAAPVLQWEGGNDADTYRIIAESPHYRFETWVTAANPSRFTFPTTGTDYWLKLTDSTEGAVNVSVQRHDGTQAYSAVTQTWTIAPADLTGTVYYWEVNTGNVVRLRTGDSAPEDFITKPTNVTCVACHSVSKNGQKIVASSNGSANMWGTYEAATGDNIASYDTQGGFAAISPQGDYVLWRALFGNDDSFVLSTIDDRAELARLTPPSDPMVTGLSEIAYPARPAWSTDGTKIAFSMRTGAQSPLTMDGIAGQGLEFYESNLWVSEVDLTGPSFSNIELIVNNSFERPVALYPTFSPDDNWIAFERATQSKSRLAEGEVWLTSPDGNTQVELDTANGIGHIELAQTRTNHEPTFLPVPRGGYFWLVFVSERKYGNINTITDPATRKKQLWVTAIDANADGSRDPSHPAFWLPGQETDNQNMRGEWALNPCKGLGEGCNAGFDCCDGFCRDDGMGSLVCSPPPMGCSHIGDACMADSDCCESDEGVKCIGGFCAFIPG